MPTPRIDKNYAQRLENCVLQSHRDFCRLRRESAILELSSGAACYAGSTSFLTQVVGWGFASSKHNLPKEVQAIESFYRSNEHLTVAIELCPLVGSYIGEYLTTRGYRVTEFNNISIFNLKQPIDYSISTLHDIEIIDATEVHAWAKAVSKGFGVPELNDEFINYAQAQNVIPFAAYVGKQCAGGGTIAMHGAMCDIGVTATLQQFRGRGLQKALLLKRLNFAKQNDAKLAIVTTEPGSISDLNIQKLGFRTVYTRVKLEKELNN